MVGSDLSPESENQSLKYFLFAMVKKTYLLFCSKFITARSK